MKNIFVFLADGFEEIEAITPIDIWRRAGFHVVSISVEDSKQVKGAHEILLEADMLFQEINSEPDLIFLPGGMPGTLNLTKHSGLQQFLIDQNEKQTYLTAICAAPSIYGVNGFLQSKKATCFPGFENKLLGAINTGASVEQDGKIITGKGAGVALEFALKVVAELKSEEEALTLKAKLQAT